MYKQTTVGQKVLEQSYYKAGIRIIQKQAQNYIMCHTGILFAMVVDPDPDSVGSVDPDLDSKSGFRTKMTHKLEKN
jgi:hypothetical protein